MIENTASDAVTLPASRGRETQYWIPALALSITLAAVGHLAMKAALNTAASVPTHGVVEKLSYHFHHPALLAGLAAYALGTLLWIFAVSRKEISYVYPLTAANYAVIAIGGKALFGETVSTMRWAGIAVVMIGVMLMHRSSGERS